jgi:hypothetical protein
VPSFNFHLLLAGAGGDNDDEEVVLVVVADDDGDVEDTNDKDVDNDGDALSSSSISFSNKNFHINGSAILPNDCVFIPIPLTLGGVVINRPSRPICSSILLCDCSLLFPILTT